MYRCAGLWSSRSPSSDVAEVDEGHTIMNGMRNSIAIQKMTILQRLLGAIHFYKPLTTSLIVFSFPCLLFTFLNAGDSKVRTTYVVIVVALFWLTEGIPICAAALLPAVLFPLLRVERASAMVSCYMSSAVMLYLGTMLVGASIREVQLDRRAALWMLRMCGSQVQNVMLGFMLCGWMLSMWISNTATTSMLLPILGEILHELQRSHPKLAEERPIHRDGPLASRSFGVIKGTSLENSIWDVTTLCPPHLHQSHPNLDPARSPSIVSSEERDRESEGPSPLGSPTRLYHNAVQVNIMASCYDLSAIRQTVPLQDRTELCSSSHASSAISSSQPSLGYWNDTSVKDDVPDQLLEQECVTQDSMGEEDPPFMNTSESGSVQCISDRGTPAYRVKCMMSLALAYSCSIGGIATLTGTTTNIVLMGQIDEYVGPGNNPITFGKWMACTLPLSAICLALAWLTLQVVWMGLHRTMQNILACARCCCWRFWSDHKRLRGIHDEVHYRDSLASSRVNINSIGYPRICSLTRGETSRLIEAKYRALGDVSFGERMVILQFVLLLTLWLTRDPGFVSGWGALIGKDYVKDDTVAIGIGLLSFILPRENIFTKQKRQRPSSSHATHEAGAANNEKGFSVPGEETTYASLLTWSLASHHIDWGVMVLLGGGFALARAINASGLDRWLAFQLARLAQLPEYAITFLLMCIATALTEFTSNTSTATILVPILIALSDALRLNMLKLCIPVVISTSFAFMLPMATPPNALVFKTSNLRIVDMLKSGIVLNPICIAVTFGALCLYGEAIFRLNEPLAPSPETHL